MNVPRLTTTCALPSTALVDKSTAARERYIQPRLGQQESKLAVKQICMRSLRGCLRGTRAEKTDPAVSKREEGGKEAAEARRYAVLHARGNNGPIIQRRLEAQRGLGYVLRIG
jgi:hypothetical protein